jgi:hypothetical protein
MQQFTPLSVSKLYWKKCDQNMTLSFLRQSDGGAHQRKYEADVFLWVTVLDIFAVEKRETGPKDI